MKLLLFALLTAPVQAQDFGAQGQVEFNFQGSPEEALQFADDALVEMEDAEKFVRKLLEQVEKEGADERTRCVRNKLAAIKALREVTKNAQVEMQAAIADNKQTKADFEFRKIAVALARVRQFRSEALACAGDGQTTDGSADVQIVGDLTTGLPGAGLDVPDIPDFPDPDVSPFQ